MKHLTGGVAVLLLLGAAVRAEIVSIDPSRPDLEVRVLESSDTSIRLELTLGAFERHAVEIGGVPYYRVALPGEPGILERGMPDLPQVCRSIIIPDDARMVLHVLDTEWIDFPDFPVGPSRGHIERTTTPNRVPFVFDAYYGGDEWFPRETASTRDPYILRDFRGMTVIFRPFHYLPSERRLRVHHRIVVELRAEGPGVVNVMPERNRDRISRDFRPIYDRRFLNFDAAGLRYGMVDEAGEMLVIVYDPLRAEIEPYAEWKNESGIRTTVVDVSEIGADTASIRQYIRDFYDSTDLAFVLLVGDAPQIPPPIAYDGAADPKYALVSGDDGYPDLFIGRFSATNAWQTRTQVRRNLAYERDATELDTWFGLASGIASDSGPGDDGELDWEHMEVIRDHLLNFTFSEVDRIYDPGATTQDIFDALNAGRSLVDFCGHGSEVGWGTGPFLRSHVNALQNIGRLPVIHDVSCANGNFAETTCFAENWVRASQGADAVGAIAIYAASINQYFDPPMVAQDEAIDVLVDESSRTIGGFCYHGSCQMIDEFGYQGEKMLNGWILFGDPSVRIRTDTPSPLLVDHATVIDRTAASFTVLVPGEPGALCGLSYEGAFLGSAFTGPGGTAVIPVEESLPPEETITLTVTAPNAVVYRGSVDVVPHPECAVVPAGIELTANPGEVLTAPLTIENTGEAGSVLAFDVDVVGDVMKSLQGSDMVADLSGFDAGTTFDLQLAITNLSPDYEWIKNASVDFPPGVTVNSSTNFIVVGETRGLVTDGNTGEGVELSWASPTAWGQINSGELAVATVNVTVASEFFQDMELDWILSGDGWGAPPHMVYGTIVIPPSGPIFVIHAPNGGEVWEAGETRGITWASSRDVVNIGIDYSPDEGDTWVPVTDETEDDGYYAWTVPDTPSDLCLVRLMNEDGTAGDVSDGVFRIRAPVTWISVDPDSGTLDGGEQDEIAVTIDTGSLPSGDHQAFLVVSHNGGDPIVVPVTLYVFEVAADPNRSTVECTEDVILAPAGNGDELVVTVTLLDMGGRPIEGVPADRIDVTFTGVSSLGQDMHFCASGSNTATLQPEAPTDAEGRAVVRVSAAGGCGTITASASVGSVVLADDATASVRSPDFNGDGFLNHIDLFFYIPMLNAGTGQCGNFNRDALGGVNFFDTAIYLRFRAGFPTCY
ncbi:MAG: C25 family cysteine peptidase [Candidatus Eisenbacteria bacterium]